MDLSTLIVPSRQLIDLGVKERCPGRVANSRSPKCDASDDHPRRELETNEQRVELRQQVSEPVSDLCLTESPSAIYTVFTLDDPLDDLLVVVKRLKSQD